MRANKGGTYVAPSLGTGAKAAVPVWCSPIDAFLTSTSEASRVLALAQAARLPNEELGVLRAMLLQRAVGAFEQFAKHLVASVLSETGHFDNRIADRQVPLKYLLDHGFEGLGFALIERDVLGNVESFASMFEKIAPRTTVGLVGSTADTLGDILQLRHSIVHHLGAVTKSDARKFRNADLRRATRVTLDDTLLRDVMAFLDWLVRTTNDSIAAAVIGQHRSAGLLAGKYQVDKVLFARLMSIFYCAHDDPRRLTAVLPKLYRAYK